MSYTWADYPPFVSWEALNRWPVQHPSVPGAVIWRDRRGLRGGYPGEQGVPNPQAPVSSP